MNTSQITLVISRTRKEDLLPGTTIRYFAVFLEGHEPLQTGTNGANVEPVLRVHGSKKDRQHLQRLAEHVARAKEIYFITWLPSKTIWDIRRL